MPYPDQDPWNKLKRLWRANPFYGEYYRGRLQLFFAIASLYGFAFAGMDLFESTNPLFLAMQIYSKVSLLQILPSWLVVPLLIPITPLASPLYFRYALLPLTVIVFLLIAGSFYVQDIYNLKKLRPAFHHVVSTMFGLYYPKIRVDSGVLQKKDPSQEHPLEKIGGPGFVLIQPGNAVTFRKLREPHRASISRSYFMVPFETIGQIVSLKDQHGYHDEVKTLTRDGIRIILREIHYRYRIQPDEVAGKLQGRTMANPYPFSEQSLIDMSTRLSAGDTWAEAVARTIIGEITNYVNSHSIDQLTAPRQDGQDPRSEIKKDLFEEGIRKRLKSLGAELLWIDIGHFDIEDEKVDLGRVDFWTAKWIGNAQKARAYGEAKKLAYQELGRAEAQADLIMSIMDAVEKVDFSTNPVENLRHILLVRTAQVLDALSDKKPDELEKT